MSDIDGVLLSNILKIKTEQQPQAHLPPVEQVPEPAARPTHAKKHVSFADEQDEQDEVDRNSDDGDDSKEILGGLIKKDNIYITMLENIKPAIIAGIIVALFQVDLIKSFVGTNISGVFSPDLSIYGFFVFVIVGAVLFWVGHILSRSDTD